MVIPYIPDLGEKFKRTCNKQVFQLHFKDTNTFKQLLMAPKDKDPKLAKSGVIYKYKCPTINCTEEYIGESGRTSGDRYKKHLKALSPLHLHTSSTGHPVSPEWFSIVDREVQGMARNIKEAMYIRVNDPSLSRNLGKFKVSHVWDQHSRTHLHCTSNSTPTSPTTTANHSYPWTSTPSPTIWAGGTFFYIS